MEDDHLQTGKKNVPYFFFSGQMIWMNFIYFLINLEHLFSWSITVFQRNSWAHWSMQLILARV
jgi:hypothetical protein